MLLGRRHFIAAVVAISITVLWWSLPYFTDLRGPPGPPGSGFGPDEPMRDHPEPHHPRHKAMTWKSPVVGEENKKLPLPPGVTPEGWPLNNYASHVFLMLKTGHRVLRTRLPVHIDTTLRRWPHHGVYADTVDVVNGVPVQDVFARLPSNILNNDQLLEYRIVRELRKEEWGVGSEEIKTDHGWDSDKFKNVPMLAEAWQQVHRDNLERKIEWYVFIDDDTFVFQGGFLKFLQGYDPDEPVYLGSPAWMGGSTFAHGGSGVVISREAMRQLFGDPNDTHHIDSIIAQSSEMALSSCCGDAVTAQILNEVANISMTHAFGKYTGHTDPFQGNAFRDTRVTDGGWCLPSFTWHHLTPREVELLFAYEQTHIGDREVQYWELYRDFILPFVVEERANWDSGAESFKITEDSAYEELLAAMSKDVGYDLEPYSNKTDCMTVCKLDNDCLVWAWWEGNCNLERKGVMRGRAENEYVHGSEKPGITSGWMVERIRERRLSNRCDPFKDKDIDSEFSEGWYVRQLEDRNVKPGELPEL